ncbi:hypothetical protein HELRODRAFT_78955 [Helobdella robusta]|uniref:Uncharacterized protein n=1 Tax=Helobdella robusta TaxID=6412 RepID=T1G3H7_HELRO|nr:hypothetical protein HELRODRAFT_78955 [Helobdella robusta]ESO04684.1 hypothetical protein HELRODRAFT_78955 [Helobdella robusta]
MTALESFRQSFERYCKEFNVQPSESLLNKIHKFCGRYTLDLSSSYLQSKVIDALSKALKYDALFTEIKLNNCQLNEEGSYIYAMLQLNVIFVFILQNNSMRGISVSYIAELLRANTFIYSLHLDSNNIGLLESNFNDLCQSLKVNRSLQILGLSNNQLNSNCSKYLSDVFKYNNALQSLDLRWNKLGLIGGRQLSSMLDNNQVLQNLRLDGNDITIDTLQTIGLYNYRIYIF